MRNFKIILSLPFVIVAYFILYIAALIRGEMLETFASLPETLEEWMGY